MALYCSKKLFHTILIIISIPLLLYLINDVTVNQARSFEHSIQQMRPRLKFEQSKIKMDVRLPLEDVYISIKTTFSNHVTRTQIIIDTWYQMASESIYFFTDADADVSFQV